MPHAGWETLEQRIQALVPGFAILKPDGDGPFPVVVQMHGCGGVKAPQTHWAEVARKAGWAVVIVDSYRHRRISQFEAYATVCTGLRLWGRERAGDMFATLQWLRGQPWVDASHLVVAGWSHGGWTALDGMSMAAGEEAAEMTKLDDLPAEPLAGLVGAFVVYPFVGPGALARSRGLRVDVNTLALVGTHDVIVGGRSVGRTLERMPTPGAKVQVVVLEGATHAFDEPDAKDIRVRHDPELTARAQALYSDYLTAAAKRSPVGAA
jgi:dienelactone hydrolase